MINVVFDLDDTLYTLLPTFDQTIKALYPHLEFDLVSFYNTFREEGAKLFTDSQTGVLSMDAMHRLRAQNAFKRFGITLSDEQADTFHDTYMKYKQTITLDAHGVEMIQHLQNNNNPVGIITNGESHKQRQTMNTLNVESLGLDPNLIIISGEFGIDKPDPKIFNEWTHRVNNNLPTIYIGDSFNHDIIGAHNAKWHPIWYNPYHKKHQEVPFHFIEISSLKELKGLTYFKDLFR